MTKYFVTGVVVVCVWLAAVPAQAQGYLVGSAGAAFGGDAPSGKATYGVAAGATAGILGIEFEFAHTPTFFSENSDSGNVLTLTGNLLVGAPIGPIRPYAVGGLGLIRQRREVSFGGILNNVTDHEFGYNIGGGMEVTLVPHVGLRGDVRYFHVRKTGGLSFGRGFVGAVLRL